MSYRTLQLNITHINPVGLSTKFPGHSTISTPTPSKIEHDKSHRDHDDDIRPEDGASQMSKFFTLLSDILKQIDDELLQKRAEYKMSSQEYYSQKISQTSQ